MLKSFPHARPNDEVVYILNIAAVLTGYPLPVVDYVTAAGTGIQAQRGRRFPPTPGEVRDACESAIVMFDRAFEDADRPRLIEQRRAEREREKADREDRLPLEALRRKYSLDKIGLKTTEDVEREVLAEARRQQAVVDHHNRIAASWGGATPPKIAGLTVSPQLAALIEKQTGRKLTTKEETDDQPV